MKVQHVAPRGKYGTVSTLLCTKKASGTMKLCNFCNQERRGEAETARFLSRVTELAFDSDSYSEEDWARMKVALSSRNSLSLPNCLMACLIVFLTLFSSALRDKC